MRTIESRYMQFQIDTKARDRCRRNRVVYRLGTNADQYELLANVHADCMDQQQLEDTIIREEVTFTLWEHQVPDEKDLEPTIVALKSWINSEGDEPSKASVVVWPSHYDLRTFYVLPNMSMDFMQERLKQEAIGADVTRLTVCGMPGITDLEYAWDKEHERCFMVARGANLRKVLAVPGVCTRLTRSSSFVDAHHALGLEAACEIYRERALECMPGSQKAQQTIDNVDLLVNSASMTGEILPINKKGIERAKGGFITKISFEDPIRDMTATAFGCKDDLTEIASCIVVGKEIKKSMGSVDA
ncbi:hypothetical protein BDK51DRAFT_43374 [Blyttiomyces helicus]|uniref:DNA-directed RNA polymerase n=1 Tax=Blyttiomyces helicus TaxID=388810 RepID=A0A4P9WQ59_9FUNG|nr:hypothetical protein BDK51DRAFT_43374 [Blyttiomyces helicus]|eukprot:RKO93928.1 hypothetical protein BDK51DRAFT_43374 [Blyttiomyces helicus]